MEEIEISTNENAVATGLELTVAKLGDWTAEFYQMLPNIIVGICILALFLLVSLGIRRGLKKYFIRTQRLDLGRLMSVFAFWALMSVGFLIFLTIIIPSLKPVDLLASLGFGSIAFGFAFKDILSNTLAGFLILLRQPFRRGDQISVDGMEGTVQAIEPRATIIRTYDGSDVIIPNTTIYTSNVIVHTSHAMRRTEIELTIGYVYNIRKITKLIQDALAPIEEIKKDPGPQVLCWELGSTSLAIRVRWWIDSDRASQNISRSRAVQAIKEAFDANDIDPTDPQLIYYQQSSPFAPEGGDKIDKDVIKTNDADFGPPPELIVSKNDPEAHKIKLDSKEETLLPEN